MSALQNEYGEKKGKSVFYAMKNEGKLTGVDSDEIATEPAYGDGLESIRKLMDDCMALGARMDGYAARMDALYSDAEEDEDDVTPGGKLEKGEISR